MFEVIENNGLNGGFSMQLPEDIHSFYTALKSYCDQHGYPHELNIDVHIRQAGGAWRSSTRQGLSGIQYRAEIEGLLKSLPVSESVIDAIQEQQDMTSIFSDALADNLDDLRMEFEDKSGQITAIESQVFDAVSAGDLARADQLEGDVLQLERGIKRLNIVLSHGQSQFDKIQSVAWCLSLLKNSICIRLHKQQLAALEKVLDENLMVFAESFQALLRDAEAINHQMNDYGDDLGKYLVNPLSDSVLSEKVLKVLSLPPA